MSAFGLPAVQPTDKPEATLKMMERSVQTPAPALVQRDGELDPGPPITDWKRAPAMAEGGGQDPGHPITDWKRSPGDYDPPKDGPRPTDWKRSPGDYDPPKDGPRPTDWKRSPGDYDPPKDGPRPTDWKRSPGDYDPPKDGPRPTDWKRTDGKHTIETVPLAPRPTQGPVTQRDELESSQITERDEGNVRVAARTANRGVTWAWKPLQARKTGAARRDDSKAGASPDATPPTNTAAAEATADVVSDSSATIQPAAPSSPSTESGNSTLPDTSLTPEPEDAVSSGANSLSSPPKPDASTGSADPKSGWTLNMFCPHWFGGMRHRFPSFFFTPWHGGSGNQGQSLSISSSGGDNSAENMPEEEGPAPDLTHSSPDSTLPTPGSALPTSGSALPTPDSTLLTPVKPSGAASGSDPLSTPPVVDAPAA